MLQKKRIMEKKVDAVYVDDALQARPKTPWS